MQLSYQVSCWHYITSVVLDELQVVVVLSGSMEPAFYRGDILFLNMGRKPFRAGEVVVFNINGRDIPIVHRIIKVHEKEVGAEDDDVLILTKVRLYKHPVHWPGCLLLYWVQFQTWTFGYCSSSQEPREWSAASEGQGSLRQK